MYRMAPLLFVIGACTGASSTGIDTSTIQCPPNSTLTYDNFAQLVIQDNCLSCHASRDKPTLATVDQVRANKQLILNAAVASTQMPKGGNMLLDERQMLGEWLACGAP